MKRYKKWTKWLGSLLVLCFTVTAFAQADDSHDAEVKFQKGSTLSPEEQVDQSEKYISKMKAIHEDVNRLAEKARADRDIIKLNCVNDKLIQIKGHLNLADKSVEALKFAIARNDENARNHHFAKLTITHQNVVVLRQESEACIGEDISFVGATKVDIDVDEDIAMEDPVMQVIKNPDGTVVIKVDATPGKDPTKTTTTTDAKTGVTTTTIGGITTWDQVKQILPKEATSGEGITCETFTERKQIGSLFIEVDKEVCKKEKDV
jgi:hypothetical protein